MQRLGEHLTNIECAEKEVKVWKKENKAAKQISYNSGSFGTGTKPESMVKNSKKKSNSNVQDFQRNAINQNKKQKRKKIISSEYEDNSVLKITFMREGHLEY